MGGVVEGRGRAGVGAEQVGGRAAALVGRRVRLAALGGARFTLVGQVGEGCWLGAAVFGGVVRALAYFGPRALVLGAGFICARIGCAISWALTRGWLGFCNVLRGCFWCFGFVWVFAGFCLKLMSFEIRMGCFVLWSFPLSLIFL